MPGLRSPVLVPSTKSEPFYLECFFKKNPWIHRKPSVKVIFNIFLLNSKEYIFFVIQNFRHFVNCHNDKIQTLQTS